MQRQLCCVSPEWVTVREAGWESLVVDRCMRGRVVEDVADPVGETLTRLDRYQSIATQPGPTGVVRLPDEIITTREGER